VKGKERVQALAAVAANEGIVVLYESPHRLKGTLREVADARPSRPGVVCRELTKLHEELARGTMEQLAERFGGETKGELTLVLGPFKRDTAAPDAGTIDAAIERVLAAGLSPRDAATAVSAVLEQPKRDIYQRVQALTKAKG
jgi:16S rRNA (cytidine1402-2'-O)-methyltransferase